jgi:isopenicillin N synthase-like dioxygenase
MATRNKHAEMAEASWSREALEEIPVLDLKRYLEGAPGERERLAQELRYAQENIGFYYIKNHGVPQELIDRMFAQTARFHAQPLEEKLKIRIDGDQTGYIPMQGSVITTSSNLSQANKPDLSEALWIRRDRPANDPEILAGLRFRKNKWPENLPGFRETTVEYIQTMGKLGRLMLPLYACALGLQPEYFDDLFDSPDMTSRLGHYPPHLEGGPNQFGVAPHTDVGFLTLLPQAAVAGLQVLTQSKQWIPALVREGHMLVNGGESLVRLTNGRFLATPHRVTADLQDHRYSIPLFYNPNYDAMLEPVRTCVGADRPPLFEPLSYYDYILSYIAANYPHQAKKANA